MPMLSIFLAGFGKHSEVHFFYSTDEAQLTSHAYLGVGERAVQMVDTGNGPAVERHDYIAAQNPCALGRASGYDFFDANAAIDRKIVEPDHPAGQCHILPDHTDVTAADGTVFD